MVRTIYQQLSPAEVHGQLDRVVEQLREAFAQVAKLLADAAPDILACTAFPVAHWQKLWSNNPQERLNREIRHREPAPERGLVGIFPNRLSARRLVGAVSIFMVIRPAIFTDIQPPWERGELTIIRL